MRAWIDDQNRAMVEVSIASHARSKRENVEAWLDTAFDGHLVMPKSEIVRLGLGVLADTDAVLADGSIQPFVHSRYRALSAAIVDSNVGYAKQCSTH